MTKFRPDGTVAWATYLGGAGNERGHGIAVDAGGSVYVIGRTTSANFPTTAGSLDSTLGGTVDAFITKLSADGTTLAYSTYLGGSGDEIDEDFDALARRVGGIAVDVDGQAYVTGSTTSGDFPTTPGAFRTTMPGFIDGFVSKVNATGSALVYSTYLGGSDTDRGHDIEVDASGSAYVTGETSSSDFPTTAGAFQPSMGGGFSDAFVTRLNPAGTALAYSSYLGGTSSEFPGRLAIDSAGAAYVTGATASFDFPTTAGAFQPVKASNGTDAYVTKVSADGSAMVYSTHLGGAFGDDSGNDIAVDGSGQAYVTGGTGSGTFPLADNFQSAAGNGDAFVTKFDAVGSALIYSSYLGGGRTDTGYGIAVDADRTAHVVGQTNSSGDFGLARFPTTAGAAQPSFGGGANDGFVVRIADEDVTVTVSAGEFAFASAPQALLFTFSDDVSASLSVADLLLENLTTGQTISGGNIALAYDANSNTASFTFPGYPFGALPDGNYRATLIAAGITDAAGNVLDGDGNGTPGGNAVTTFFFLNGDANRDRSVNFADLLILRVNYGMRSGATFSQGDFNYDRAVNFADLLILRAKYGSSLPSARPFGGSLFGGGDDGGVEDDGLELLA